MIVVRLIGGLGNQLFQYSTARALAEKTGSKLYIDLTGFETYKLHKYGLDRFNITASIADSKTLDQFKRPTDSLVGKVLNKLVRAPRYVEGSLAFDPSVLGFKPPVYLDGYFQTEKYFKDVATIIRRELTVKDSPTEENERLIKTLKARENTISVHIRRGDYVSDANANAVHGTCSVDYYKRSGEYFANKCSSPLFIVFSDDIAWAADNIKMPGETIFVRWNDAGRNYEDLRLQSLCHHNIIANSTFSWWGAWLGGFSRKEVIAPKVWFGDPNLYAGDIVPSSWLRF